MLRYMILLYVFKHAIVSCTVLLQGHAKYLPSPTISQIEQYFQQKKLKGMLMRLLHRVGNSIVTERYPIRWSDLKYVLNGNLSKVETFGTVETVETFLSRDIV